MKQMRKDAKEIFYEAIRAVEPGAAIHRFCRRQGEHLFIGENRVDLSRFRNIYVIGAGKATAPMAKAMEELLENRIKDGLIIVKYGHTSPLEKIRTVEAGHPVPDENGEMGARRIMDLMSKTGQDDLVFSLISGGGSALLPLPSRGLTLSEKQQTVKTLLGCGASIHEINTVRKHISDIKGGRLAKAAFPATLMSLILSDVVGDDPDVIASGPTVPDSSTFRQCLDIVEAYRIRERLPETVVHHLEAGCGGRIPETPDAHDPAFSNAVNDLIGSNIMAIKAAEKKALQLGYNTLILSSMIEGETRHVARMHGAIAREILKTGHPARPPACLLSGGETTVTIRGAGLGGRNQEFALAAAMEIADIGPVLVLSAGSDGTDGPTDAAGAFADEQTVSRAQTLGLNPRAHLDDNDAYRFFEPLGDLFLTGPTRTNVMDLRIILVGNP